MLFWQAEQHLPASCEMASGGARRPNDFGSILDRQGSAWRAGGEPAGADCSGYPSGLVRVALRLKAPRASSPLSIKLATLAMPVDRVSVVVPTLGRPELIARLLHSLSECDPRADEVIVVDQSQTDATEEATRGHARSLPCLVYARMARACANGARNVGISLASGEIIALTDDDCIVSPEWVKQISTAFGDDPDLACLMGRVLPAGKFQGRFPVSVRTSLEPRVYLEPQDVDPSELGWTCNLAFRASYWRSMGGFDDSLGPGTRWPVVRIPTLSTGW